MTFCVSFPCHDRGGGPRPTPAGGQRLLDGFEARLAQDPASLRVAAEYRQLVIDTGRYDRSIKLFERLARDPRGGANRFVNLALANVDKVPVSGSVRRALLGRDALDALTRAIAIEPTDLAYLIRGLVNLYYDQFVFHRTDKGVADLETARRLSAAHPQVPYAPRILVALGDGYWRLNRPDKARELWREGLAASPGRRELPRAAERARRADSGHHRTRARRGRARGHDAARAVSRPDAHRVEGGAMIAPGRLHHRHPDLQRARPSRRAARAGVRRLRSRGAGDRGRDRRRQLGGRHRRGRRRVGAVPPVRVIHRAGKLGLGSAVLEGFAIAQTDIVGVMDGDLSHPPELLPRLFRTIEDGNFDLVVGSRYVRGGGTSNFPIGRWLLSRAGCWLARPLTPVRDAMSGFFLIRRTHLDGFQTSVKGFKIGLELFVRSQPRRLAEVGYVFVGRTLGESKMSLAEGTGFLRQLFSLYRDAFAAPVRRPACVTVAVAQERAASASLSGA